MHTRNRPAFCVEARYGLCLHNTMNRQQHIDLILDHYEHPRHRGAPAQADLAFTSNNPGCGDVVTVYLHSENAAAPVALAFDGQGCTVSQAAASMVMELLQGKTLGEIETASVEPLLALIGPDIAGARQRCATLAFDAVKHAGNELAGRLRTEQVS